MIGESSLDTIGFRTFRGDRNPADNKSKKKYPKCVEGEGSLALIKDYSLKKRYL